MKIKVRFVFAALAGLLLLLLLVGKSTWAQGPTQSTSSQPALSEMPSAPAPEGKEALGYRIKQSIEFGGRISDVTGSVPMYDTLVNLQSGPRLLEQTLSMDSLNHSGVLFDNLYLNSFGWGGDPSNVARLRISHLKWYHLDFSFRLDQNYFDYNLLANPLNPPTSVPNIPVVASPHSYFNRRRLYDFNLVALPHSRVSFLFEFDRNRNEGPSFSSYHVGTEALLSQPTDNAMNTYHFGMDVKLLPKTTVSYTQVLQYFNGDTNYFLAPLAVFPLSNGQPANLGLTWDTVGGSPCGPQPPAVTAGVANPVCNGYLAYNRTQRVRTSIPTEELSLQSTSIKKLDVVARAMYSSASMTNPPSDFFNGLDTLFNQREIVNNQSDRASWVSVSTDVGATYYVNDHFRIVDSFRFSNYRIPAFAALSQVNLFNAASVPPPGSLLFPPVPLGTPGLRSFLTGPDVVHESFNWFLGEDSKSNQIQLEYDLSAHVGLHAGYRYRHRLPSNSFLNNSLETFLPPGADRGGCANPKVTCTTTVVDRENNTYEINEHTGLFGIWVRPTTAFRLNANTEFMSADNFVTRISPLHQQQYRVDASYTPRPWLTLAANVSILQQSNRTADINFQGHNQNYGFDAIVSRDERLGLDLAYNFTDYKQNANVCYVGDVQPAGSVTCLGDPTLLEILGNYTSRTHYGLAALMFKPARRLTTKLGYSLTDVGGNVLILNALQPLGSLASHYQLPLAAVALNAGKGLTWNVGWNYYQYNENSFIGPTLSRYFHSNVATISVDYAF